MATQTNGDENGVQQDKPDYDAIVIGAGFAGLRIIHNLRNLGLTYKGIEAGTSVGGTWYWNRYPGARTDSESWVYILNFSKELNDDWTWKERFPRQPEVLEYLNHVADRFDMRKDYQFNTKVKSCHWDDTKKVWTITTDAGEKFTCRYFISAAGVLSVGRELPFKNHEKFKGESYKTYAWPKHEVSYAGKRIAVIGTGYVVLSTLTMRHLLIIHKPPRATAVQIIPVVAHSCKELTVFQRTPNYVLPARNHPLTEDQDKAIKSRYAEVWEEARNQAFGMSMVDSKLTMKDMKSKEHHRRMLEYGWEIGGFRFIFETFADLIVNQEANDIASEFVREKIRSAVRDEETAERLCPDYPIFAKRPPLGHYYLETFNKPHVRLVDVKNNPIEEITEKGLKTSKTDSVTGTDDYEFDMIIYAIGFDASTGAYTQMDIRGTEERSLGEHWAEYLETFLGICVEHYPNMFMLSAPQSPFANLPIVLDNTADWIEKVIGYMEKNGYKTMEPTHEGQEKWCKTLNDSYNSTVLPQAALQAGSWYIGANVPGKKVSPLFWFGGAPPYFQICQQEVDNNFPGLTML
ncbi:hypothetical protein LTR37_017452 [Vermiconidia calcicola]|uniref:Uncharacterized protein n=1 Tax=Vermiconidia calcicola TaxID=1690605 RepID=A0ACC3MJQ8_9PEZI|nr:hypothetical protein LTR37_017452 [Vermiconidia calcicola]